LLAEDSGVHIQVVVHLAGSVLVVGFVLQRDCFLVVAAFFGVVFGVDAGVCYWLVLCICQRQFYVVCWVVFIGVFYRATFVRQPISP
jgi:uncharacterized membrane protein